MRLGALPYGLSACLLLAAVARAEPSASAAAAPSPASSEALESARRHFKNGVKLSTPSGYGATFVTFNVDGDPKKARGYVKNVAGVEIDSYEITRQ